MNLGFSGDRTEHVLWRLFNGEFDTAKPKVLVLLIGTNNTGHKKQDPAETASGIQRIIGIVSDRSPQTKILLVGVFPRGAGEDDPMRQINDKVNARIATLADGERIQFLDLGKHFAAADGTLPKDLLPDQLHLTPAGYAIWATAMEKSLAKMGGWPEIAPPPP